MDSIAAESLYASATVKKASVEFEVVVNAVGNVYLLPYILDEQ